MFAAEPGYPSTLYEIVGVIPDTRYSGLRDNIPTYLIEQGRARSTVPDFQRDAFNTGSLELGRGSMHHFDRRGERSGSRSTGRRGRT